MSRIKIRGYEDKDKAGCRKLWEELTVWHREIYGDPNIGGSDPGLYFDTHLSKAGPEHLLVALHGETPVGLAGYLLANNEAEVEPLVVSAKYRGRGIGTLLLDEIVRRLEESDINYLSVRPVMRNTKAIGFFRNHGFNKLGHVELFMDFTGQDWKKDIKLLGMEFER